MRSNAWNPGQLPASASAASRPLGVHALAQFEFCHRAGLLTLEMGEDDSGEEIDSRQRLDYLPDYEEALIRERLEASMRWLWLASGAVILGLIGLAWTCTWRIDVGILCAVPLTFVLFWWASIIRAIVVLRFRLDAAMRAVAREPDLAHLSEQHFNWWELRRAGYQVDRMPEPLTDLNVGLRGRPWRVLRKGSLRIPVFRKHRGDQAVHSQHRVRVAAYCQLIEACEGSRAPFGLVMFAGSYDVVLIPYNAANQAALARVLAQAQQVVSVRERVPAPPPRSACSSCHFGRPTPVAADAEHPSHSAVGLGGQEYYSICGARFSGPGFKWVPPHAESLELGLE